MSRFTDSLKAPAAPGRTGPATRQGRKHVGVYVLPDVAHRLRVLAAQEDTSTQALIVAGYRDAVSVPWRRGRRHLSVTYPVIHVLDEGGVVIDERVRHPARSR